MYLIKNNRQLSLESPQETKRQGLEKLSISHVGSQRYLGLTPENYYDNNCIRDVGEFRSRYGKCE